MNDSARMIPPLRSEINGAPALVTLDRPEKRNALSIELRFALGDELSVARGIAEDPPAAPRELEQLRAALLG